MKVVVAGSNLPGRVCAQPDGRVFHNVHVGIQVKTDPTMLVPADAEAASWEVDVRVSIDRDGQRDFSGTAVHGKRGDRFLYLTWGNVDNAGSFKMFRRGKLMLHRIDAALVDQAETTGSELRASVDLTDEHGYPRCGRFDPPALTWTGSAD